MLTEQEQQEKYKQEVAVCVECLSQQKRRKSINMKLSSYSLKHFVEKWHEKTYGCHRYISDYAVIAAFDILGIPYKMCGGDAFGAIKLIKEKKKVDYTYITNF